MPSIASRPAARRVVITAAVVDETAVAVVPVVDGVDVELQDDWLTFALEVAGCPSGAEPAQDASVSTAAAAAVRMRLVVSIFTRSDRLLARFYPRFYFGSTISQRLTSRRGVQRCEKQAKELQPTYDRRNGDE